MTDSTASGRVDWSAGDDTLRTHDLWEPLGFHLSEGDYIADAIVVLDIACPDGTRRVLHRCIADTPITQTLGMLAFAQHHLAARFDPNPPDEDEEDGDAGS